MKRLFSRSYIKSSVSILCFLLIFTSVFMRAYHVLEWKVGTGVRELYEYPQKTMDVIIFGSSHAYNSVNPAIMWGDSGIAAYNMGESGQHFGETYYYLKEAFKTQKPKVALVEIWGLFHVDRSFINLYYNTLGMKSSANSYENIKYAVEQSNVPADEKKKYEKYIILKFPIFHSRYDEIGEEDFKRLNLTDGGYKDSWETESMERPAACDQKRIGTLPKEKRQMLDKLLNLCQENGVELVLWVAPYYVSDEHMLQFNSVKQYAAENSITFFNFNEMVDEIGFDYAVDIVPENGLGEHINAYGAEKVTGFLRDFLDRTYSLENKRGTAGYEVYEEVYQNWLIKKEEHAEDLENARRLSDNISMAQGQCLGGTLE